MKIDPTYKVAADEWWKALTESERQYWAKRANSCDPVYAYDEFCRTQTERAERYSGHHV